MSRGLIINTSTGIVEEVEVDDNIDISTPSTIINELSE